MAQISVRPMAATDLDEVTGMIRALSLHHGDTPRVSRAALERDALGDDPWIRIIVAEADGQVVGYAALLRLCWLHYGDRGMELYHLFVRPGWRRTGAGRALVEAAAGAARAAGCVELKVGTHPDNAAAQSYYLARGFVRQEQVGQRFRLCL